MASSETEPRRRSMGVTNPSTCAVLSSHPPTDVVAASPSSVCAIQFTPPQSMSAIRVPLREPLSIAGGSWWSIYRAAPLQACQIMVL